MYRKLYGQYRKEEVTDDPVGTDHKQPWQPQAAKNGRSQRGEDRATNWKYNVYNNHFLNIYMKSQDCTFRYRWKPGRYIFTMVKA